MDTPLLWHVPLSHFNEKARWALDYKGEQTAEELISGSSSGHNPVCRECNSGGGGSALET
jgi:hypothetical protein